MGDTSKGCISLSFIMFCTNYAYSVFTNTKGVNQIMTKQEPFDESLRQRIEQYNRELMAQYASVHPTTTSVTTDTPEITSQDSITTPESDSILPNEYIDIGTLQVRVSTENQAIPIKGARVTISHDFGNGNTLDRLMITDSSGLTSLLDLPTKDRTLSLSPGAASPFAEYTIEVNADGYYTKRFNRVPIYGGVTAIQSVTMLPLPEFSDSDAPLVYNAPEAPNL